jgi:cytochrome P450
MLDLLGLPDSDENMMRHWSDRCSNFLFQSVAPDKRAARNSRRAASVFHAADRGAPSRARRRHDFGQACAEVAGERLSDLEILATCHMMATAGGGTSRSAIAMSLWWLQWFPDQLAALKARPEPAARSMRRSSCGLTLRRNAAFVPLGRISASAARISARANSCTL